MSPSGLVYAVIVALWAAVLIPIWLRRHDDAAVTRSADRYSRAMRTLSRRPPRVERRELVVPRRPDSVASDPRAVPRREVVAHDAPGAARRPVRRQASVRAASARLARRRARSLLVLASLTVLLSALAVAGVVPVWSVVPVLMLLVGFVVHLRLQAKRSAAARRRSSRAAPAPARPSLDLSRAVVVETKGAEPVLAASPTGQAADAAVGAQGRAEVDARADVETSPEQAWRPESWPVPTYVNKPKAIRPIRVIDLTTPGAWTSGRLLDDEVESQEQVVEQAHKADDELNAIIDHADPNANRDRRAVND